MKTDVLFSPEQKKEKAKELYESIRIVASLVATSILVVVGIPSTLLIQWLSLKMGFGKLGGGPLSVFFLTMGFLFGQFWALRKVRQAGLSQESQTVEAVPRTAAVFPGEPVLWPGGTRTKAAAIALTSLALMGSLVGWVMWHSSDYWLLRVEGVFFFVVCSAAAIGLAFNGSPSILIDETGITTAPYSPWRRHLQWQDIERCEILRATSLYGNDLEPSCVIKNQRGEVLLQIPRLQRQSLPLVGQPKEHVELEAEIKRRLTSNAEVFEWARL